MQETVHLSEDIGRSHEAQQGSAGHSQRQKQYWLYTRTDPQEFGERATICIEAFA